MLLWYMICYNELTLVSENYVSNYLIHQLELYSEEEATVLLELKQQDEGEVLRGKQVAMLLPLSSKIRVMDYFSWKKLPFKWIKMCICSYVLINVLKTKSDGPTS